MKFITSPFCAVNCDLQNTQNFRCQERKPRRGSITNLTTNEPLGFTDTPFGYEGGDYSSPLLFSLIIFKNIQDINLQEKVPTFSSPYLKIKP